MSASARPVAVTGLGAICAIGRSPQEIFEAALAGRSGVQPAPDLAVSAAVPLAARAPFEAQHVTIARYSMPLDRCSALGVAVARQALVDAGVPASSANGETGVYWGTSAGGNETLERAYQTLFAERTWRLKPTTVVTVMHNAPAAAISIDLGVGGPSLTYSVACASAAVAIGEAMLAVRSGRLARAIAGGSEACITRGALTAWSALRALATTDRANPAMSCKPFAADRSGFVLGEGGAAVVLEDAEQARARGAHVYAELAGYGVSSDAAHMAEPSPNGQARAIAAALLDAGIGVDEVGYVNAHGTATRAGDRAEVDSIRRVFGARADSLLVSSTKALHGHVMGATGAIELVIALLALHTRSVPPTAHLASPDPSLELDFVPNCGRHDVPLRAVASNSFAFGGTNAVLVARHPSLADARAGAANSARFGA
jgi:3-oxoacyl-[acyl-carrier-protein] synthase II